jgi:hypothetical protein
MKANPFFELYVGDRITSRQFVQLFSDKLVPHTESLFLPGNIVVTGIQGSGKSMLLSLLKVGVRLEFEKENSEFPVPSDLRKFITCSVNLAHSSAIDFGYRSASMEAPLQAELLFADFLNYLLMDNLISTLRTYGTAPDVVREEVGVLFRVTDLRDIAAKLSTMDIWEGWLQKQTSLDGLQERIRERIKLYRRFLHMKDQKLSDGVLDTITAIGQPIIQAAKTLKTIDAVSADTNFFAEIDQYEELCNIATSEATQHSIDYRSVINKALSSRSPELSYRIGTRGYSWKRHGKIHGTAGNLEATRDYKYIDLDALLRKSEQDAARSHDVFREFSEDVFERRVRFAGYNVSSEERSAPIKIVYSSNFTVKKKINEKLGLRDKAKYVYLDPEWSASTKQVLSELARKDLFSAKLGEIWVRQKGDVENLEVPHRQLPWELHSNRWWKKERAHALLLQIASQSHQRSIWGGADEVIELSGGSILAFIMLNQYIWSAWLQREDAQKNISSELPEIDLQTQSIGILRASTAWLELVPEQTGKSAERRQFIKHVASILRQNLMNDKKLSYPGASGFSLLERELERTPRVATFLEELSDYGNILMLPHTSKEKGRPPRIKFYFHPTFCPALGLPSVRTKEPYYAKVSEVGRWMKGEGRPIHLDEPNSLSDQQDLFGDE